MGKDYVKYSPKQKIQTRKNHYGLRKLKLRFKSRTIFLRIDPVKTLRYNLEFGIHYLFYKVTLLKM